ncbi:hypothetical protein CNR22_15355 [Sphingobacteriaceae bacterium]|nr:hypothetical protein CNR22_15355 [Sphingobacteriaceae bacterium]
MKKLFFFSLLTLCGVSMRSQNDSLFKGSRVMINRAVSFFEHTTIDRRKIDSNYFKGKITILSFFGFGCGPCYTELSLLNEISKTYPKDNYQILLIGSGNEKDLRDLRAYNSKREGKRKTKLGLDTLAFDIIADCPGNSIKTLFRACNGSKESFHVDGVPTSFFINREGIIKEVCIGFSVPRTTGSDHYFLDKMKEAEK